MPRVSKRKKLLADMPVKKTERLFKVGIYGRISVDDGDSKRESVEHQITICREYLKQLEELKDDRYEIADEYRDYGKSGTSFSRPEFLRLQEDIRVGAVNCVMVKDLSRFARDHIEAGKYIETVFPFLNVRFIAVNDGIDTFSPGFDNNKLAVEIKNLVNEMYSRDCSSKTKSSLAQRRNRGEYTATTPLYGYRIVREETVRTLCPDEKTRRTVEIIFRLFVEYRSYKAVSDELYRQRINPPKIYHQTGMVYAGLDDMCKYWDSGSLKQILTNENYVGVLVQGKEESTKRGQKRKVSPDKWDRIENHHAAIIDRELFDKTQRVVWDLETSIAERKTRNADVSQWKNIFGEFIFCGVCGKRLKRSVRRWPTCQGGFNTAEVYMCQDTGGRVRTDYCPESIRITTTELNQLIMESIRIQFDLFLKRPKYYCEKVELLRETKKEQLRVHALQLDHDLIRLIHIEEELYREYLEKRNLEQYLSQKKVVLEKIEIATKKKEICLKEITAVEIRKEEVLRQVRALLKLKKDRGLSKEVVQCLINRILVYPDKRIEIEWAYRDPWFEEGRI